MSLLHEAWAALGGAPERAGALRVEGGGRHLPSVFDVDGLAVASVGAALLAAAELAEARGRPRPEARVDARHVAVAFASERHLRVGGEPPGDAFAPLSRFARTRDGWIRLHANYPHHRAALLAALDHPPDPVAAVAERDADELEEAIVAAGGCAAAVRPADEWRAHPQGAAVAELPLVDWTAAGDEPSSVPPLPAGEPPPSVAPLRTRGVTPSIPPLPAGAPPATGLRVLDLTRVIAGPVGTRTLAALGADVLRLDAPHRPELPLHVLDTGAGKRTALLDLRTRDGRATLSALLAGADAVVHGYRPGALAPFGIDAQTLAAEHPHLVTVQLSAWGHAGPWARRRGFDSLVQAACGIAAAHAKPDGTPGALPVQALDHATGHLAAATTLRALIHRARTGEAAHARLALARTAHALMARPAPVGEPAEPPDPAPHLVELDGIRLVRPPGTLDGEPLTWRHRPHEPGADTAEWPLPRA